jgi:hypothetical protein
MTSTLMCSAAGRSCGFAASLPSLCCPGPALADTLAPDHDPLSLCDGHHQVAVPAVAPHPDVHLEPRFLVYVWYMYGIYHAYVDLLHMYGICMVYVWYIPGYTIHMYSNTYTMYIQGIYMVYPFEYT